MVHQVSVPKGKKLVAQEVVVVTLFPKETEGSNVFNLSAPKLGFLIKEWPRCDTGKITYNYHA